MLTSDGFNGTYGYANPERSKERLRQCKVVILKLQHKKAGLIKEITVQNGKTDLGNSRDPVLHDDEGNLGLKKEDYLKFWPMLMSYEI